ncbi:gamma-tubulin complex component 2-like isoform X2 [Aricia agestis]|uniref:gamma-tubulin complex component 2-like isoform X2 n=1 Tax=Aricia agestis TaxID=91739 RepID=UPI001C207791|nr:gamma-tubulin complex component 2-like isoform X2 [Aricia agestis]
MYQNWILPGSKMQSTIKELLDALGCNLEADTVLDYIQNDPNYGNSNLSSKQINEYAQRLAVKASNSKTFLKKYEDLKQRNTENLADIVYLFYKLVCEEKKSRISKPKVAPKPVLNDNKHQITKEDVPQIKDKLLKAVDESKKLVMKSFEEKEAKLRPNWYNSLDLPNWQKDHPAMSWDFPKEQFPLVSPLAGIPVESQENIIIDELLYLFSGVPGNYIVNLPVKETYDARSFQIAEDLDDALKQIVRQMLPLASNYSIVRRFIEDCDMWSGRVLHALVAAIEELLKDYYTMIAQLETEQMTGNLSLQKLWYFILPTMHTMQVLAAIVTSIGKSELRGGAVLTVLHEKTNTLVGDVRAQEISLFLTERACRPYLDILDEWIHKGTIVDPFQEFMIEDNELINKEELPVDYSADYWEKRYSVQRDRVPKFLDKFTDIILRTGKYLNVISQCGNALVKTNTEEIKYSLREQNYGATIQKAYAFASKSLLELLMKEYDLMGRLKSVKNYFLMSQGDFIVQFMDATEQELSKKIDDIIPSKLESLLGLCLRLSAASHDPYNEDMRVELLPYDLQFQMFKILSIETEDEKEYKQNKDIPLRGIETFSFGMEVKWPVSLVLNHKAIACYQMIFRHLFYCKHVERMLCRVWLYNKVVKRFSAARLYAEAFALRTRMLSCVQHLQYYMCVEVIEPSWCQLMQSLEKVNNVDEVLERHSDFLESCLGDCMLTSPQLLKAVTTLCLVCVQFCTFMQEMHKYSVDAELNCMLGPTYDCTDYDESAGNTVSGGSSDSFGRSVSRYGLRFTAALLSVLAIIDRMARDNNTNKLLNISARLNFNTYYVKQLEKFCTDDKLLEADKKAASS